LRESQKKAVKIWMFRALDVSKGALVVKLVYIEVGLLSSSRSK
jgi:hypothetical protein